MKLTQLMLTAAVAGTMALAGGKAWASSPFLTLNISGTVETYTVTDTKDQTQSSSFNSAKVYLLISNAVANASSLSTGEVSSVSLPANGYIAFNPNGDDEGPDTEPFGEGGTFYVTNKTGYYYPLSGFDNSANYYSWIELDNWDLGFDDNFEGVENYTEKDDGDTGPETDTMSSLLYIHDNPYSWDDGDYPYEVFNNNNALEIRGIMTFSYTYLYDPDSEIYYLFEPPMHASMSGSGNAVINGNLDYDCIVKSGHASFSP